MTLWIQQNHRDSKRLVVARERGVGINGQSTEDFYGSKTTLYDIIMMDICHYIMSKPLECKTPRVNLKAVNLYDYDL